jgi:hypothetical protein
MEQQKTASFPEQSDDRPFSHLPPLACLIFTILAWQATIGSVRKRRDILDRNHGSRSPKG